MKKWEKFFLIKLAKFEKSWNNEYKGRGGGPLKNKGGGGRVVPWCEQMRDSLSLGIPLFLREILNLLGKRFGFNGNTHRTGLEDNFYSMVSFGYSISQG